MTYDNIGPIIITPAKTFKELSYSGIEKEIKKISVGTARQL